MQKFKIGGTEYDATITYRVRRWWIENCKQEKLNNITFEESEDMVLDSILMCLVNKSAFKDREHLMDVLENDEFKEISNVFGSMLNPDVEGKKEIEKKPEPTTAT